MSWSVWRSPNYDTYPWQTGAKEYIKQFYKEVFFSDLYNEETNCASIGYLNIRIPDNLIIDDGRKIYFHLLDNDMVLKNKYFTAPMGTLNTVSEGGVTKRYIEFKYAILPNGLRIVRFNSTRLLVVGQITKESNDVPIISFISHDYRFSSDDYGSGVYSVDYNNVYHAAGYFTLSSLFNSSCFKTINKSYFLPSKDFVAVKLKLPYNWMINSLDFAHVNANESYYNTCKDLYIFFLLNPTDINFQTGFIGNTTDGKSVYCLYKTGSYNESTGENTYSGLVAIG